MASTPEQPNPKASRPVWQRLLLVCLNLLLAAGALWLGMSIPSYFRSVSPLVLEAAASGTPTLTDQAEDQLAAGRPGLAGPLIEAHRLARGKQPTAELEAEQAALLDSNPAYRWSGGPAPFYEQFLELAEFLREDETAVIPTLLPAEHRAVLLRFLRESPNRNVQSILETRTLGGWSRFYPVYSTSGHPLEATILATALLEQSSGLPEGIRQPLLTAIPEALKGDAAALRTVESLYIGVLTLGRHANWLLLEQSMLNMEEPQQLLFAAQAVQQEADHLHLLYGALYNTRETGPLVDYLLRHEDRGWDGLKTALAMGQGAVRALIEFDKPVYHPPAVWTVMPEFVLRSQQAFKGFAETWPEMAIGARAAALALCGFFLVGVLRVLILGRRAPPDRRRRVLINLDSLVGGILVMILVWVLIEPGLLDFRPNEEGTLQISLAQAVPDNPLSEPETSTNMIDQVTILILLLFFVIQMLVFIFGLVKIAEVKRQPVTPEVKMHLLDNEENLFDLGLYIGLGGTVSSLILVVLNVVDASLMAAYASTLFGIIFVAFLKVGFLRPYRRQLILQRN